MECLQAHRDWLSLLAKASSHGRKDMIRRARKKDIDVLSECCYNLLKGRIKMPSSSRTKLKKYKHTIRFLAKPGKGWKTRQDRILQRGGAFLPLLLGPLISGVASIIGSLINRQ